MVNGMGRDRDAAPALLQRFTSGVTHLVRLAGWAAAPAIAGLLMAGTSLAAPLVVGATLKIVYDIVLWRAFRNLRPPEEMR